MTNSNERSEALSFFSDMHKDAYGFRPRVDFDAMTLAELHAEGERCSKMVQEQLAQEAEDNDPDAWKKYV